MCGSVTRQVRGNVEYIPSASKINGEQLQGLHEFVEINWSVVIICDRQLLSLTNMRVLNLYMCASILPLY